MSWRRQRIAFSRRIPDFAGCRAASEADLLKTILSFLDRRLQFIPADARQALRMRRLLMAAASAMLLPLLLLVSAALGQVGYPVVAGSAVLMALVSIAFFAVFRTGANLRFSDHSMTWEMILCALLSVTLVCYWADQVRPMVELFYGMALIFGAFRLGTRKLLGLAAIALGAHAAMLLVWHATRSGAVVTESILDIAVLAVVLPWFAAIGGYVNALRSRLSDSNRKLTEALARIENIAVRDELTGLYNRRFLMELLAREATMTTRTGRPFAVSLFDIDHFKSINDTFGHGAGDSVLRHFAAVAEGTKRGADVFGRLGGEEFLMVMPDTNMSGAVACAERVRKAIAQSTFPDLPADRKVTLTAGVACSVALEETSALLARADAALYQGKAGGRNRVITA